MGHGRIKSAAAPGMAAGDSFGGAPGATDWAVFVDGVDGVLGAGGDEAAVAAEESAESCAIEQNELNQQPLHRFSCQLEWSLSIRAVRSF